MGNMGRDIHPKQLVPVNGSQMGWTQKHAPNFQNHVWMNFETATQQHEKGGMTSLVKQYTSIKPFLSDT